MTEHNTVLHETGKFIVVCNSFINNLLAKQLIQLTHLEKRIQRHSLWWSLAK